jgi:hypothetical protein
VFLKCWVKNKNNQASSYLFDCTAVKRPIYGQRNGVNIVWFSIILCPPASYKSRNSLLLPMSVCLVSALHCNDFGSARYGLVYATGRQGRYSPVKKHSARRGSLHCYTCTLLILCGQRRNDILNGSTEESMRRACHTNFPASRSNPSIEAKLNDADNTAVVHGWE